MHLVLPFCHESAGHVDGTAHNCTHYGCRWLKHVRGSTMPLKSEGHGSMFWMWFGQLPQSQARSGALWGMRSMREVFLHVGVCVKDSVLSPSHCASPKSFTQPIQMSTAIARTWPMHQRLWARLCVFIACREHVLNLVLQYDRLARRTSPSADVHTRMVLRWTSATSS